MIERTARVFVDDVQAVQYRGNNTCDICVGEQIPLGEFRQAMAGYGLAVQSTRIYPASILVVVVRCTTDFKAMTAMYVPRSYRCARCGHPDAAHESLICSCCMTDIRYKNMYFPEYRRRSK